MRQPEGDPLNELRPIHQLEEQLPSARWYGGVAFSDEGIRRVFLGTPEFMSIGDGEMRDHINEWGHGRRERGSSSELDRILDAAEEFIKRETGFSPQELFDFRIKLEEQYSGQREAPFHVEWIVKEK